MIENGDDQDVLAILRERVRQLDLDIEIMTGRRAEVIDMIFSLQPDARRQARWPERGGDPAQEAPQRCST
jgi:hypothetical protein